MISFLTKKNFRVFLTVSITLALVIWFAMSENLRSYYEIFRHVSLYWLGVTVIMVPLIIGIRGLRLAAIIDSSQTWFHLKYFKISAYHSFFAAILPGKLGEVSLPLMLKASDSRGLASGAGVLLLVRLYDVVTVFFLSALSSQILMISKSEYQQYGLVSVVVFIFCLVALLTMPSIISLSLKRMVGIRLPLRIVSAISSLNEPIEKIRTDCSSFRIFGISILLWIVTTAFFYFCAKAMSMPGSFPEMIIGTTGATIAFSVPLNGIANVGPIEAFWTYFFTSLGVTKEVALGYALVSHTTMLMGHSVITLSIYLFTSKKFKPLGPIK